MRSFRELVERQIAMASAAGDLAGLNGEGDTSGRIADLEPRYNIAVEARRESMD